MASPTRTTTWVDQQVLTATALNNEFNNLLDALNIVNADIASGAAISWSKINSANITIIKPTFNGSIQALTTDSDGATVTFDLSASNIHSVVLAGNRTLALSNVSVGQAFVIRLIQDGSGSRTVTWFGTIKWPNGNAPTLSTGVNKTDVLGFICTSSGNYDGYIVGQNL